MSRRYHKKSRNGCAECKRRHIRCDENHPICANCSAAEMRCSFLSKDIPYIVPEIGVCTYTPPHVTDTAGRSNVTGFEATSTNTLTPVTTPKAGALTPPEPKKFPNDAFSINMIHVELFNNLHDKDFLSTQDLGQPGMVEIEIYLDYALSTPYLMHQGLAISALHLSIRRENSREFYRGYATGLQNRALSLFKESNPVLKLSAENCVQLFFFSSFISVHLLCDTFHYHKTSLETFLDRFTSDLSVYRGVLAVVQQYRLLPPETEEDLPLKLSEVFLKLDDPQGSECDSILNLINSTDSEDSSKAAYQESISCLQQLFDAQRVASGSKPRTPLLISWPILVPPDYVDLLRQLKPEALIILAHYAILLHRGRDLWLIGEGGRFLIEAINQFLGSSWQKWLSLPNAALHES